MIHRILTVALVIAACLFGASRSVRADSLLGVNLAQAYDWSPPMLADAVRQGRAFGSFNAPHDGKPGAFDGDGWPVGSHGIILAADVPVQGGTYRFRATQGTLRAATLNNVGATNIRRDGNVTTADFVIPAATSLTLKIDGSGMRYSLRRPGVSDTDIWMPEFIAAAKPFGVLRAMDVTGTNGHADNMQRGNTIRTWADRPTDKTVSWQWGVPLEALIDLANKSGCDLWYCVPHLADDDYVAKAAQLFHDKLDPSIRVYFEYSNEVWNGGTHGNDVPWYGFAQAVYVDREAKKQPRPGPLETPWTDDWTRKTNYTASLSLRVAKIVKPILGDRARVILPLQSVQSATTCKVWGLYFTKLGVKPSDWFYGVAGAPYTDLREDLRTKSTATTSELFAGIQTFPDVRQQCVDLVVGAKSLGLQPIAYEGCLNLWDQPGSSVPAKVALQTDPRVGDYLREFYAGWFGAGGREFCHYQFLTTWRPDTANFGIIGDALDTSGPKYRAMAEVAAKYQAVATVPPPATQPVPPTTQPSPFVGQPTWYCAFDANGNPFVILRYPDGRERILKPVN